MLLKANFIVLSHFHKAIVNNDTQKECGGSSQLALLRFISSLAAKGAIFFFGGKDSYFLRFHFDIFSIQCGNESCEFSFK